MNKHDCRSAVGNAPALALVVLLCGCASLVPRNSVPETLVTEARVPDIHRARWWGDEAPADVAPGLTKLAESPREKGRPVVNYLALSSGGDDGAFAAGVLVGWTRSGRRPRFEIVTGVSAGALIAPFAFLGPAYDKDLEAMWTGYASGDLITPQPLAQHRFYIIANTKLAPEWKQAEATLLSIAQSSLAAGQQEPHER